MRAFIIDAFTTGGDNPTPIEVAWMEFEPVENRRVESHSQRFNPGDKKISFPALASHYILPGELTKCPPLRALILPVCDYLIGHDMDVTWAMIAHRWPAELTPPKLICTMSLSIVHLGEAILDAAVLSLHRDNLELGLKYICGMPSALQNCRNIGQLASHFYWIARKRIKSDFLSEILEELYCESLS